jgi:ribosomal protein L9
LTDSGLSDFDLHLFGEGRHERIYDKLGAHPVTLKLHPDVSVEVTVEVQAEA